MTERSMRLTGVAVLGLTLALWLPASVDAQTVRVRYESIQARHAAVLQTLAAAPEMGPAPTRARVIADARAVIAAYEALVRRYHMSGYADNALFNAAGVAAALHERFGEARDRTLAIRLYNRVGAEYPSSSLAKQIA